MSKHHILLLLEQYEKHSCLWDPKNANYKNENAREAAIEAIIKKLQLKMTPLELRMKIKNVRTIYCKLLNRIEKSKKDGSGKVFKPCLTWYSCADKFLRRIVEEKKQKGRVAKQNDVDSSSSKAESSSLYLYKQEDISDDTTDMMDSQDPLHEEIGYATKVITENEEAPGSSASSDLASHQAPLAPIQEDEFDIFCKHVAHQLRCLPLPNAIKCQTFINNYLAEERLKVIYGEGQSASATVPENETGPVIKTEF